MQKAKIKVAQGITFESGRLERITLDGKTWNGLAKLLVTVCQVE